MSNAESLPSNWARTTLGEICSKPQYGWTTPATHEGGKVKLLRTTDITDGVIDWGGVPFCVESPPEVSKYQLIPNDIVISRAGSVGVSYLLKEVPGQVVFASYLIRFCPITPISPQYVSYFLHAPSYWASITEKSAGIAVPNVNARKLEAIELPLAPAKEQVRISSKLDELFSDLDASVAALERARANLKRYRASVLKAAVEGRLTAEWRKNHPPAETASQLLERILVERRRKWEQAQLAKFAAAGKAPPKNWKDKYSEPAKPVTTNLPELPEGWCWAHIEQLCEYGDHALKAGPFGSAIKKSMYVPDGYKIYGQEQVIRGDPYYGDYFIDQEKFDELSSCAIKPGDLLISLVGTIGRTLVLPGDCRPGIINPRLIKISLERKLVFPAFLQAYIRSPQVKTIFKLISHGGTMDVLNMGALKALAYPLPPLAEQEAIVDALESADDMIGRSEIELSKSTEKSIQLRQSILKRAFEGRLVPQDPKDEPASVLLERIRAARAKPGAAPAKGTRRRGRKPAAAGG